MELSKALPTTRPCCTISWVCATSATNRRAPVNFNGTAWASQAADRVERFADTYIKNDVLSIEESIVNHVEYTLARSRYNFDNQEAYQATALSLRDRLIESWNDTQQYFK